MASLLPVTTRPRGPAPEARTCRTPSRCTHAVWAKRASSSVLHSGQRATDSTVSLSQRKAGAGPPPPSGKPSNCALPRGVKNFVSHSPPGPQPRSTAMRCEALLPHSHPTQRKTCVRFVHLLVSQAVEKFSQYLGAEQNQAQLVYY
ncbi:hypothetical protein E2C01_093235 [Portunus trituberculatus]|uniref:Uncharacterized protein n=1 Tax=Portunus trituberculatus TaxID=210409 RepID=A0A5B7JTG2_PORTR|nr:hypothetical protein [Portunus trituberculatus]